MRTKFWWLTGVGVAVIGGLSAVLAGGPPQARAEGGWTILPQEEWSDEFTPRYTDGLGHWFDGDPTAQEVAPTFFPFTEVNPDTEDLDEHWAVQNEALVNFYPHVPPAEIESILDATGVEIVAAWYEPEMTEPSESLSWFQVRALPATVYYENVPGLIAHLTTLPEVDFAEYNLLVPGHQEVFPAGGNDVNPSDPFYATAVGFQEAKFEVGLRARTAWQIEIGGTKHIGVAVIDSGIDVDHEDFTTASPFSTQIVQDAQQKRVGIRVYDNGGSCFGDIDTLPNGNATLDLKFVTGSGHPQGFKDAHGTNVAGIVAAKTNNGLGVASCAPESRVMSVTIPTYWVSGDNKFHFATANIVKGIKAIRKNLPTGEGTLRTVRVVNMSLGSSKEDQSKKRAIRKDLYKKGQPRNDRLYVASAGNDGKRKRIYPAAYPFVLGVVGVDLSVLGGGGSVNDYKDANSNYYTLNKSDQPDLDVYGTSAYYRFHTTEMRPGLQGPSNYVNWGGTSASAPQIAALASLLYSADDSRNWQDVDDTIKRRTRGSDLVTEEIPGSTHKIPGVADFTRALGGN